MPRRLTNKNDLLLEVRRRSNLRSAWQVVRSNGLSSNSGRKTKSEIAEFDRQADRSLETLYRGLQRRQYSFHPAVGWAQPREGKAPRPVVIACVSDRIVQRAILQVIQEQPLVRSYVKHSASFGGLAGIGIRDALQRVADSIREGKVWVVRSDIEGFFTKIPRATVVRVIGSLVPDRMFIEFFAQGMETELSNMAELCDSVELFPILDTGVAQGCCLSPLAGNVLLHEFDEQMNRNGVTCLRFIDDFLILARTNQEVRRAFSHAQKLLKKFKMRAYLPDESKTKAHLGHANNGFDFLGCRIATGTILPSKKSIKKLMERISQIADAGIQSMAAVAVRGRMKRSDGLVPALREIDDTVRGWADSYRFCGDQPVFRSVDRDVDQIVSRLVRKYLVATEQANALLRRRLLGVHVIQDTKFDPIIWKSV
jgi:retron-type reverse transcriptase